MPHRPLNPRIVNNALDANALDLHGDDTDDLVHRFNELLENHEFTVVVPGGVRDEVSHPNTPNIVRENIMPQIFNLRPELNSAQQVARGRVAAVLQGNASPQAHAADASHLSEAAETGCGFFITNDQRILRKRGDLAGVLPPSLFIVTLAEFLEIFDRYGENGGEGGI